MAGGRYTFISFGWLFRGLHDVDTVYSIQAEFTALCKLVSTACAKGKEVEGYVLSYRERQKTKMEEIWVSRCRFDEDFLRRTEWLY